MAVGKNILDRMKSVKNTGKITRAMELISTVKMKKAQEAVYGTRPFAIAAMKIFSRILSSIELSQYCREKDIKTTKELVVVITSNRGLCGAYNVNMFREIAQLDETKVDYQFVTIGKKAREFILRTGQELVADFSEYFDDDLDLDKAKEIANTLRKLFQYEGFDRVHVMYSYYISALSQKCVSRQLYPMQSDKMINFLDKIIGQKIETSNRIQYKIEPSEQLIADQVVPMVLDVMFYEMMLEAKASEHAARMVAMKSASKSSRSKVDELRLVYNKERQASITREVSEIVAGVESMRDI